MTTNNDEKYILPYGKLIRVMVDLAGKTARQVSREIGRSDSYITSVIYNSAPPNTELLVEIARACGFELTLTGHGHTFEIPTADELKQLYDGSRLAITTITDPDGTKSIEVEWKKLEDIKKEIAERKKHATNRDKRLQELKSKKR